MRLDDLVVEVRDATLTRRGQIPPEFLDVRLEPADRAPGAWTVRLPSEHPLAAVLAQPGSGIIVTHTDPAVGVLLSGPTDDPEQVASTSDPQGMSTFTGTGDTVILWQRTVWPDPAQPVTAQSTGYDTRTSVPAETVMHWYVNRNVGPGARSERRALTMGPDLARGGNVTKSARFDTLGDLLSEVAAVSGLGFRVVQVGNALQFQTYATRDRSSLVRLDLANGTLASQQVARSRPRMTHAIVAGQGQGEDRTLLEVATTDPNAALYGPFSRWEGFLDQRQTDDPQELQQAGEKALAEAAGTIAVTAVPGDDSTMRYPQDWREGDQVAVVMGDQEPKAVVTGVAILVNSQVGVRIGATIGDVQGWDPQAGVRKRQDALERRIDHLERHDPAGEDFPWPRWWRLPTASISGVATAGVRITDQVLDNPYPQYPVLVTYVTNVLVSATANNALPGLIGSISTADDSVTWARYEDRAQEPTTSGARQVVVSWVVPAGTPQFRVTTSLVNRNTNGALSVGGGVQTDYSTVTVTPAVAMT